MSVRYWDNGKVVAEKYVGHVLSLGEHNYYDDSDFYALVFDPEQQKLFEVEYGTTRFASSNMSATVDATPEVLQAYKEYVEHQVKLHKYTKAMNVHDCRLELHQTLGVSFKGINRLLNAYGKGTAELDTVLALLSVKKFRSEFRKGMADKVREWLADENPKYRTPLSYRQLQCMYNKHQKRLWWAA